MKFLRFSAPFLFPSLLVALSARTSPQLAAMLLCLWLAFALCVSARYGRTAFLGTDPTGTFTAGGVKWNTQTVTINSVVYIAREIDYRVPVAHIVRKDKDNLPDGDAGSLDQGEGSLTLQLAAQTTVVPPAFATFTIKDTDGTVSISLRVLEVGRTFTQGGETMVKINVKQVVP